MKNLKIPEGWKLVEYPSTIELRFGIRLIKAWPKPYRPDAEYIKEIRDEAQREIENWPKGNFDIPGPTADALKRAAKTGRLQ